MDTIYLVRNGICQHAINVKPLKDITKYPIFKQPVENPVGVKYDRYGAAIEKTEHTVDMRA